MPEGLDAPASAANAPPRPGVGDGTALEDGPSSLPGGTAVPQNEEQRLPSRGHLPRMARTRCASTDGVQEPRSPPLPDAVSDAIDALPGLGRL